jgi:hypothetical protein
VAGGGDGPLPDGWGLQAGMPRPWRVKALRSDGQVVPSSVAASTLPSRSAKAKACSASAGSVRNRLDCQPRGWRSSPHPYSAPHSALGGYCRRSTVELYVTTARMRLRPAA